jgi:hypothetical protein
VFDLIHKNLEIVILLDQMAHLKSKTNCHFKRRNFCSNRQSRYKRANLASPNLVDFNQWITFDTASWSTIDTFNKLVAANGNTSVSLSGNNPIEFGNLGNGALDGRVFGDTCYFFCTAKILS